MGRQILNPKVPDERHGYCLSNDAFWFIVKWFAYNSWSKLIGLKGGFRRFSQNANIVFKLRKGFLKTFFRNALIQRQISIYYQAFFGH